MNFQDMAKEAAQENRKDAIAIVNHTTTQIMSLFNIPEEDVLEQIPDFVDREDADQFATAKLLSIAIGLGLVRVDEELTIKEVGTRVYAASFVRLMKKQYEESKNKSS